MTQLLPRCAHLVGFGGTTGGISVLGGMGSFATAVTFGVNITKAPVALASSFRYLTVLLPMVYPTDVTLTLLVDGVATAQTVTVPAGALTAVSGGAAVAVTAGQDVVYQYVGTQFVGTGHGLSVCLEREGDGQIYGLTPAAGSVLIGNGYLGGAFNNGILESLAAGDPVADSNTYSITALDGTITTLVLRTYAGAPGSGVWTGRLRVNLVTQDGTGGTVDTSCVLTGSATVATATFALPVTLGQHVDVVIVRTGAVHPFANANVGVGIGVTPDTADAFMLCGGSNDVVPTGAVGWRWPGALQLMTTEAEAVAPISASGLTVTGLYVERAASGGTDGYVHTIRRSETDTTATVTLTGATITGLIADLSESFAAGQTITLQSTPVGTPLSTHPYWGLAATSGVVLPPEPTVATQTVLTRRLRRAPHLSEEQQWMFYHRFQVDLEAGLGLVDGQGSDPQVMVRWSDDGGHTWSNEHWVSAGRMGQYTRRVLLRRLGRGRDRVFEVVVSDPNVWNLVAAYLTVEPGNGA